MIVWVNDLGVMYYGILVLKINIVRQYARLLLTITRA